MVIRKSLIFATLLATSCAYFNTFYNTENYFKEAEKIYREQGQLTREASTNYNKVIEKSSKIFEYYKTSPFVDDALFYTAIAYKRLGNYSQAKIKFEELFKYFPNSKYRKKALLEYVDLLITMNYLDEANATIKKNPELVKDQDFLAVKSKLLYVNGEYRDLLNLVNDNWKALQKNPSKKAIYSLALEAAVKTGNIDMAERVLKQLEKLVSSDNERAYLMTTRATILANKGDYEQSIKVLEESNFPENSIQYRNIKYEKARILTQAGLYDRALEELKAIEEKSIRDSVYFKALFLKGKIMETLDSLSTALSIYQDLRNFPISQAMREEVELRYKTLLEVSSDTLEESDESKLRKAELFLYDLKNPEKALKIYEELTQNAKSENVKLKALYAEMLVYLYHLKNEEKAREIAERIVSEYPESTQASKILELNLLNVKKE
jgi:tetratricopeptide (TPR) repeat protein